jgi:hypothetical protein
LDNSRYSRKPSPSAVFVPFAVYYMKQPVTVDYLYAAVCLLGAVYFVFRGGVASTP